MIEEEANPSQKEIEVVDKQNKPLLNTGIIVNGKNNKRRINYVSFVQGMINNGYNAKRAYMKVWPKCTEKTAEVQSWKLLRIPEIQLLFTELLPEWQADKTIIQALNTNTPNTIGWSDKYKYVELVKKLKGRLSSDANNTTNNIAMIIDTVNNPST